MRRVRIRLSHDVVVNGRENRQLLIAEGADVNATDGESTPLHTAEGNRNTNC